MPLSMPTNLNTLIIQLQFDAMEEGRVKGLLSPLLVRWGGGRRKVASLDENSSDWNVARR